MLHLERVKKFAKTGFSSTTPCFHKKGKRVKEKRKKRKKESNLFLLSKCCVSASSKLSLRICILNPRLCQKFNSLKLNPNLASTKRTDSKRSSKDLTKAVFEEKILTRQSCTRINQNTF